VRVQFVLPQRVIVHDKACCVSVLCVLGIWRAGSACLVIDLLSYGVQMLRAWRFGWRAGLACRVIDLLSYGVQMLRAWLLWLLSFGVLLACLAPMATQVLACFLACLAPTWLP
jgi:hypothetical protein